VRTSSSTVPDMGGATGGASARSVPRQPQSAASATDSHRLSTLRLMGMKEALLAEYDHEMGTTRRLLERVPDDKLAWKPHDRSMAFGALATHLASLAAWGGTILIEPSFDLANAPPNQTTRGSRAEILALFDESTKATRALMDRDDASYMAPWSLKRGGQPMFTLPRIAAFRSFVLNHMIHHRGQLSVYLRLNEILVPPIYGPSADEG
jgi:uncharacterized damage-inducible protein DinB